MRRGKKFSAVSKAFHSFEIEYNKKAFAVNVQTGLVTKPSVPQLSNSIVHSAGLVIYC